MERIGRRRADRRTLDDWLTEWYGPAYRTAYLILLDHREAERAVHDAFLRAWRMRTGAPRGAADRAWVFRAVVNACGRRLSAAAPGQSAQGWAGPTERLADLAGLDPALRQPLALMVGGLDGPAIAEVTRRRPAAVESDLGELVARLGPTATDRPGEDVR